MIPLFTELPIAATGVMTPGQWPYVRTTIERNVAHVIEYYRAWAKPIVPAPFLMRLLQTLDEQLEQPLERYYRAIDAKALHVAQFHGMTSSISKGRFHRGVFYDALNPELLIALDEPIADIEAADKRWESLYPIRVLTHPMTDLSYALPNRKGYAKEQGLVAISIHVPMLALQYRAYVQSRLQKNAEWGTAQFIEHYVLPGLLPSHMQQVVFNRLYNQVTGQPERNQPVDRQQRPPIGALVDIEPKLDHVLEQVAANYGLIDPEWGKILQNTPALFASDAYEMLQLPDLAPTAQVQWALIISRLKAFDFLVHACGGEPLQRNQSEVSTLLRAFRHDSVATMLETQLPTDAQEQLDVYISRLLQVANKSAY